MAIDVAMAISGLHISPDTQIQLAAFAKLALAAALINAVVFLLVNPLRADRVPDRFPIILQDAIVIGLILLASTFLSSQLVTTSAVSAVVLGFALQDTLGNAFAGLAIQSEKPFHVGQWVRVGDYEGRVAEVTWRATKLRTKAGQLRHPAQQRGREGSDRQLLGAGGAVPARGRSRRDVPGAAEPGEGGDDGGAPAFVARADDARAGRPAGQLRQLGDHLPGAFWIDDYAADEAARDEVRTAIYYSFQRHDIEIPWPIQVQYEKDWNEPDVDDKVAEEERLLAGVDLFSTLPPELRSQIARSAPMAVFGSGESDRPPGRGRPVDVRRAVGQRERGARAVARGGRAHRARRVLRRDVAPDRRAAHGDGARGRRRRGGRNRRRPLPPPGHRPPRGDRENRHGRDGPQGRARADEDRRRRGRDRRDDDVDDPDEEVPAPAPSYCDQTRTREPSVSF